MDRILLLFASLIGGFWKSPPFLVVLITNAIPLAGVLWFGWSPLLLLLLYWAENVIVGAVNILKMIAAAPGKPGGVAQAAGLIPFFIVHYGMFCLGHLLFSALVGAGAFDGQDIEPVLLGLWRQPGDLLWAAGATAALHLVNFGFWLHEGGPRATDPQTLMAEPYGRILVLHVTILGGAFLMSATGLPASAIPLLAVLKTIYDLYGTARQERKLEAATARAA